MNNHRVAHSKVEGYRDQDGCHNCVNVFRRTDFDEGYTYYCTSDAPPRPPCMSVSMKESLHDTDSDYDLWDAWKAGREVNPWGTCEDWERAE